MSNENNNKFPTCNLTIKGEEYYDNKVPTIKGKSFGSKVVLPMVLISLCCTCMLSTIFLTIGYRSQKILYKYTPWVIIAYILAFCCFSSFIGNIVHLYKIKKNFNVTPNNPNRRPCISSSDNNILIV